MSVHENMLKVWRAQTNKAADYELTHDEAEGLPFMITLGEGHNMGGSLHTWIKVIITIPDMVEEDKPLGALTPLFGLVNLDECHENSSKSTVEGSLIRQGIKLETELATRMRARSCGSSAMGASEALPRARVRVIALCQFCGRIRLRAAGRAVDDHAMVLMQAV